MTYRSQWGQDKWLEENIFKGKRNGIFVEVGVLDGLHDSNTAFFEFERDWTGLLIEPNLRFKNAIKVNRTKSKLVTTAAYDRTGSIIFKIVEGTPGWSGIEQEFNGFHHDRVKKFYSHYTSIPCAPLADLMTGFEKVDYLSIDVEGAEFAILKNFPFDKFDIEIFGIENNPGSNDLTNIMAKGGYKKIHSIEYDDFYAKE